MMQTNRIFPILCLTAAMLFAACSSTREEQNSKQKMENFKIADAPISESELKKISEPAIRDIFRGIHKNDYSIFRKPFHEKLTSEQSFRKLASSFRAKFGELEELKYLDTLQAGMFKATVWKARFARSEELKETMRKDGKNPDLFPVPDLLIRLYLGNENGTWKVYSIIFN